MILLLEHLCIFSDNVPFYFEVILPLTNIEEWTPPRIWDFEISAVSQDAEDRLPQAAPSLCRCCTKFGRGLCSTVADHFHCCKTQIAEITGVASVIGLSAE